MTLWNPLRRLPLFARGGTAAAEQTVSDIWRAQHTDEAHTDVTGRLARAARRVGFRFDSVVLDTRSVQSLSRMAGLLAPHPELVLYLRGHCREFRSSGDYARLMAIKRGHAVLSTLRALGAPEDQVRLFQRPLPADDRYDHLCMSRDHQVEFRVRLRPTREANRGR